MREAIYMPPSLIWQSTHYFDMLRKEKNKDKAFFNNKTISIDNTQSKPRRSQLL
jgi:hypothetical protein